MHELAKKRLSENLKQSIKYLTLVFNDFFILALIFLFGALMFWYAQVMKTLPANKWYYNFIVGLVMSVPLLTGKLVTLLKKADIQFLFTQDEQMNEYLKPMISYSMVMPSILIVILGGIIFPFATLKAGLPIWAYLIFLVATMVNKYFQLIIQKANLFKTKKFNKILYLILPVIFSIVGATKYTSIFYLILMLILGSIKYKSANDKIFDWRYAVYQEKGRKDQVYTIFSMFTDVVEKQVNIKRRKYLDFLLPKALTKENPNLFLYRRSLLRNPEYLNLLVRMTCFAILISWLVQDWRWALILSCVVIFLTVYQLLPMATEFDHNLMYRVYPIERENRGRDLVKVLTLGLVIQWLLISIFWLILLPVKIKLFEAISILLICTLLITAVYLPTKVKKMNRKNIRIR